MTEPIRIPIELDFTVANKQLADFAESGATAIDKALFKRIMMAERAQMRFDDKTAHYNAATDEWKVQSAFPLDSIQLLLDMVRKVKPFDLVTAIKAALQIAEYVVSVFSLTETSTGLHTVGLPRLSGSLEEMLVAAIQQHDGTVDYATKYGINTTKTGISLSILKFILAEVMKWIAEQVAK